MTKFRHVKLELVVGEPPGLVTILYQDVFAGRKNDSELYYQWWQSRCAVCKKLGPVRQSVSDHPGRRVIIAASSSKRPVRPHVGMIEGQGTSGK